MNENRADTDPQVHANSRGNLDAVSLSRVYLQSGAYQEAEAYARRALLQGPSQTIESALLLAESLWSQGKQKDAIAVRDTLSSVSEPSLIAEIQLLDLRILIEAGRYQDCLERFEHLSVRPATQVADIWLRLHLAQCYGRLYDLRASRRALDSALEEAVRLGWTEGVAHCNVCLALLDRTEGNWARAESLLLKAKEAYARLGLFRDYVQATLNLGLQRLWRGHLRSADETLNEAVRLAAEMGDIRIESTARADRGLALVRLGQMDEAREELARALRLARRQASPRRVAIALEYTGECHIAMGQYGAAANTLRRALTIANRIAPEGDIIPEVLRRQAEVALFRQDIQEAIRLATDAESRAARLGDKYERATAIRVRGQALAASGSKEEGHALLRSALDLLNELGEIFERDRILTILGERGGPATSPIAGEAPVARETARSTKSPRLQTDPHRPEALRNLLSRHGMIGSSRLLMDVMRQASLVAPIQLPVLIQGETGTGKELLARAIHVMGTKPNSPFVAFNCATCPTDLLDAELFGHARGAFTGAMQSRDGLVRSAQGGTLFLDEIGELREESQARLLRLLDSGEVRPLGTDQSMRVRLRIVAATHVDLKERIRVRRFRPDLYFRLAGIRLILPPLRERPEDIRELVAHFMAQQREAHPQFAGFGESALRAMESFDWPGNVRQLKMEVERLAALTEPGKVVKAWTPLDGDGHLPIPMPSLVPSGEADQILQDPTRLLALIRQNNGQAVVVARILGRSRSQIYRILKRGGIDPAEFRPTLPPTQQ